MSFPIIMVYRLLLQLDILNEPFKLFDWYNTLNLSEPHKIKLGK